jgi:hypothetical protein
MTMRENYTIIISQKESCGVTKWEAISSNTSALLIGTGDTPEKALKDLLEIRERSVEPEVTTDEDHTLTGTTGSQEGIDYL